MNRVLVICGGDSATKVLITSGEDERAQIS